MPLLRFASIIAGLVLGAGVAQAQVVDAPTSDQGRDLAVFRSAFFDRDIAYTADARAEAERRLSALAAAPTLGDDAFELELARIVALADNGHSVLIAGPRSGRQRRVPLRLEPFGDSLHVVRARTEHADLLGARLVAIDGHSFSDARDQARTLFGGTPALRDRSVSLILESPSQLNLLGIAGQSDAALYRFETSNGRIVERMLSAEEPGPNRATVRRNFYPLLRAEEEGWAVLLANEAAPWSLLEPGDPFRWRDAPEVDGLVVDLRQVSDAPDEPIAAFLSEIESVIATQRPRNLVLDLRMNGGGDLTKAREFMQALPDRIPGRIFVLTSPWTFSAAISSLGYLEQAAPDKVVIVGEAVGDRLMFFAEGAPIALPVSGIRVLAATERHDYADGCRAYSDCHGWVTRHPISVPDLEPDIVAPWTIDDYQSGRDPALAAVIAVVAAEGGRR